jgi:hypothetical protein
MDGACAALTDAAAEFRAGESDVIANDPQQRRLRIRVHPVHRSVDGQVERHGADCSLDGRRG